MRGPLNRGPLKVPMNFPRGRPDFVLYIADCYFKHRHEATRCCKLSCCLFQRWNDEFAILCKLFSSSRFPMPLFLPRLTFLTPRLAFLTLSSAWLFKYYLGFPQQGFWKQGFSRDLKHVWPGCENPGLVIPEHKFSHERKSHFHDSEKHCLQIPC